MTVAIIMRTFQDADKLAAFIKSVGHKIAWIALDKVTARGLWVRNPPQLLLFDLTLQNVDPVQIVVQARQQCSCEVIVVAPETKAYRELTFNAMAAGAIDLIAWLPVSPAQHFESVSVLKKIRLAERLIGPADDERLSVSSMRPFRSVPTLLAIGASAGGPAALRAVLQGLERPLTVAVVVVQHIDPVFSENLAHWLSEQCSLPVILAEEKSQPEVGTVALAATKDHLILGADLFFHYSPDPIDTPYRPSIDRLFDTAASHWPETGFGVLLTGMGNDGADGLLKLRKAGWHTIAQDRTSSAVYGMPAIAKQIGAAIEILPLNQIADSISRNARSLPRNGAAFA